MVTWSLSVPSRGDPLAYENIKSHLRRYKVFEDVMDLDVMMFLT